MDRKIKDLLAMTVSMVNRCEYCSLAHEATALMVGGSEEQVTDACLEAIKAAGGHQGGRYMRAPGCEITADTPPENIEALARAARTA